MIDELSLTEEQAESIVQKAIDFQVYTDDMPDNKKGKLEAAHEVVAFTIDSWQQERPDLNSEAGKEMVEMFDLAGVTINDDGSISYGSVNGASAEEPAQEPEPEAEVEEAESPFDIDTLIEGYSELTAATRIKKLKALELDPADDDDYNTLVSIAEWEEGQDQPSSRVLSYLNELIPPEDEPAADDSSAEDADASDDATPEPEAEAPADDSTDDVPDQVWTEESLLALARDDLKAVAAKFEVEFPQRLTGPGKRKVIEKILEAQENRADDGGQEEPLDPPWDDYDQASDIDIIAVIDNIEEYVEGDPGEALEYMLRYERSMEEPSRTVVETLEARLSADESPTPEALPATGIDPDVSTDVDQAVANDDDKERPKSMSTHLGQFADAAIKAAEHHASIRKAGLTAPDDYEGDMPELPADIDAVDHSQLSNLMHAFQNALSTATWQASMAYIEADMFEEIADYLENHALLASDQTNDTKRKAEARTDAGYLKYRSLYKQRYHDYVRFRDLAKTLEGKVKVLSRTGGFKEDEQEAGDLRARRPKIA